MPLGQVNLTPWDKPTVVNPLSEGITAALNAYYKPQEQSADVALKQGQANQANATANFTGPQIAATLLSNPTIRDTMDPAVIKNLTQMASNGLTKASSAGFQSATGQNPFINLFHHGLGLHHLNEDVSSPSNPSSPQGNPDNSNTGSNQDGIEPIVAKGPRTPNSTAPDSSTPGQATVKPDTDTNRTADVVQNPGTTGGYNAAAAGEAQETGLKTTAQSEAQNIQQQWKERQDKNAKNAQDAQAGMVTNLNILHTYPKMGWAEKGPIFGKTPAMTTEAQDFDRYKNQRANQISQGFSGSNLTGPQMDAGLALKVSRENTEDSVHHAMAFDNGMQARIMQHQDFDKKAQSMGLLPTESDILWSRYISERPFWDPDRHVILKKNFDYAPYFSQQAIDWARSPDAKSFLKQQVDKGNIVPSVAPTKSQAEQSANTSDANQINVTDKDVKAAQAFQMPSFTNATEFQSWYDKQDPETQNIVAIKLTNQKNQAANDSKKGKVMQLTNTKYAGEG